MRRRRLSTIVITTIASHALCPWPPPPALRGIGACAVGIGRALPELAHHCDGVRDDALRAESRAVRACSLTAIGRLVSDHLITCYWSEAPFHPPRSQFCRWRRQMRGRIICTQLLRTGLATNIWCSSGNGVLCRPAPCARLQFFQRGKRGAGGGRPRFDS